jgi:hypothetical protein
MNNLALTAAEQIAALINSQPNSPRVDQMEAVIAGVMTRQDTPILATRPAPAVLDWHRHLAEGDKKWMGPDADRIPSEDLDALIGGLLDADIGRTLQAFAKPVRSWDDVALLGAMAMYWNFAHHSEDDQKYLRDRLIQMDSFGMDEQSVAHLLKAICTMGGFAPGEIPTDAKDDPSLSALQQKMDEVDRLYEAVKGIDEGADWLPAQAKADAADNDLTALSKRIFAAQPITIHNVKQRALLAKYWQQHGDEAEKWVTPSDCDAWEDQVMAHLIDGVLKVDTPRAE